MSHARKWSGLRVCVQRCPSPLNSQTNPSPLNSVDFSPPTFRTEKSRESSNATMCPVSTMWVSPASTVVSSRAP
jgi:hypothetical protein